MFPTKKTEAQDLFVMHTKMKIFLPLFPHCGPHRLYRNNMQLYFVRLPVCTVTTAVQTEMKVLQ